MSPDEAHVSRFNAAGTTAEVDRLRCLPAPDELDRAERYYFPGDRGRFMVRRAQLWILLGLYLSALVSSFRFQDEPLESRNLAPQPDIKSLPLVFPIPIAWHQLLSSCEDRCGY